VPVQAAAIIGESMDKTRAAITVMDKKRCIVQTAIYLYLYLEGNEIQGSETLIQLILRFIPEPESLMDDIYRVRGRYSITTKET
jgi:hypothetical protein